jgi:ribosomal protein S3
MYGKIGVKCWICRGDKAADKTAAAPATIVLPSGPPVESAAPVK